MTITFQDWLDLPPDMQSALWALREDEYFTPQEAGQLVPDVAFAQTIPHFIQWGLYVGLTADAWALVNVAIESGWSPDDETITWADLGTFERQCIILLAEPIPGVQPTEKSLERMKRLCLVVYYDRQYHLTSEGKMLYARYRNPEQELAQLREENLLLRKRLAQTQRHTQYLAGLVDKLRWGR